MKKELTARGMGTEMWTERLQEIMIEGRKCTLFLQDILLWYYSKSTIIILYVIDCNTPSSVRCVHEVFINFQERRCYPF